MHSRELTKEESQQYLLEANNSQLRGKRAAALVVLTVISIYLYWDVEFLGWSHPAINEMLWSRIILSIPAIFFICYSTYNKVLSVYLDQWILLAGLLIGLSIIINMYQYGLLGYQLRIDGLLLYTFMLYCIPGLYFRQRVLAGCLMFLLYCILMSKLATDNGKLAYDLVYLMIFNLVGGSHSRGNDIKARLEYYHKIMLKNIADTDQLTGIFNRHGFEDRINQLLGQTEANRALLALTVLDIDFFKKVNDNLGHIRGDCCLREVAQTLLNLREDEFDLVVRFGGEEFIVVFFQRDGNRKRLLSKINKICPFIEGQQFPHPDSAVSDYVTVSAGVCIYEVGSGLSRGDLMHNADKALYFSKDTGRNRCSIADVAFGDDVNVVSISAYLKGVGRLEKPEACG